MKKLLALVLAAVMALSIVPIALADNVPTLSICSADNTFGLSTDPELQQAVVSMLEEKCGVKLEAIIPPIGSYNEKLETMMAGGDAPDVFSISQAMTRLPNYVAREQTMELNDLIAASPALSAIDESYYNALAIGGKIYDTVCVMDIQCFNDAVASEQYIDRNGRTVLWRRFNRDDWAVDRFGGKPWSEKLPDNERLTINGQTFVHWYDCVSDYIF